ncbi:MAG: hypothetical protein ACJAYC_001176 [Halieaceae bacterium]|jgi:hypothetical protein
MITILETLRITVNQWVAGSSPASGAIFSIEYQRVAEMQPFFIALINHFAI